MLYATDSNTLQGGSVKVRQSFLEAVASISLKFIHLKPHFVGLKCFVPIQNSFFQMIWFFTKIWSTWKILGRSLFHAGLFHHYKNCNLLIEMKSYEDTFKFDILISSYASSLCLDFASDMNLRQKICCCIFSSEMGEISENFVKYLLFQKLVVQAIWLIHMFELIV